MTTMVILGINIAVIAFYIFSMIGGYRKGFILQLVDLCGFLISIWIGWSISPILAKYFSIFPSSSIPLEGTVIGQFLQQYIDRIIWAVIVIAALYIFILLVVNPLLKFLQKIPVLRQVNGLLGMGFSLIISTGWIMIFAMILSLPMIQFGQEIVDKTLIGTISKDMVQVVVVLETPLTTNNEINNFIQNFDKMNAEELAKFEEWIKTIK